MRRRDLIVTAAAATVTFAVATRASFAAMVIVLVGGGLLALWGRVRPVGAVAVGVAAVAIVPVYALPRGLPLVSAPVGLVAIALVPAALAHLQRWRWHPLDVVVLATAAVRVIAGLVTADVVIGPASAALTRIVLPYACFRLLGLVPGARRAAAVGAVASGAVLAVVGLRERAGVANPFFDWARPGPLATQWARPEVRFDGVRAEASFGHPIAFGLFLALVVVLAAALLVRSSSGVAKVAAVVAGGLATAALVATLSRGPIVVAVVALAAWGVFVAAKVGLPRVALAAMLGLSVLLVSSAGDVVGQLVERSHGATAEAASAEYRFDVFRVLTDPQQFSLVGRRSDLQEGTAAARLRSQVGLKSLDSEFVRTYATTGVVGLGLLLAFGLLLLRAAARAGLDVVDRAWAVGMAATFLGLTVVATITQHADLVWIGAALVASAEQSTSREPSPGTLPRRAGRATSADTASLT